MRVEKEMGDSDEFWVAGSECNGTCGDLEAYLRKDGFYKPWGIPFRSFEEVKNNTKKKKTLIIGDSYQKNMYIEWNDLVRGRVKYSEIHNELLLRDMLTEHAGREPNPSVFYLGNEVKSHKDLEKCMLRTVGNFLNRQEKIVSSSVLKKKREAFEIDFRRYGAATAFTLSEYLRYECFVRHLSQFQRIVVGVYVHDVKLGQVWYDPDEERRKLYLRKMEFVLRALTSIPDVKIVWMSAISHEVAPEKYKSAQATTRPLQVKVRQICENHGAAYVDQFSLTVRCNWKNCTSSDHHYSRIVNRVKALRALEKALEIESGG